MAEKTKENLTFQAEVSKLLDLVANSLYSEREIFLRELISNSADACEKLRYQSLSKKNLLKDEKDLKINIRVSKKKKISVSESYITKKIQERNKAKNDGNFILADKIRKDLSSKGIILEDQKNKTIWKTK